MLNIPGFRIIESGAMIEQYRFPKAKGKRIRKKWRKRPENFRPMPEGVIAGWYENGRWIPQPFDGAGENAPSRFDNAPPPLGEAGEGTGLAAIAADLYDYIGRMGYPDGELQGIYNRLKDALGEKEK